MIKYIYYKCAFQGCLGGSLVKYLPLAQIMIPGSWNQALHRLPPHWGPASPSVLSL